MIPTASRTQRWGWARVTDTEPSTGTDWNVCRYCGRDFPTAAVTARPMHEVYRCPQRPAASQTTLDSVIDDA